MNRNVMTFPALLRRILDDPDRRPLAPARVDIAKAVGVSTAALSRWTLDTDPGVQHWGNLFVAVGFTDAERAEAIGILGLPGVVKDYIRAQPADAIDDAVAGLGDREWTPREVADTLTIPAVAWATGQEEP